MFYMYEGLPEHFSNMFVDTNQSLSQSMAKSCSQLELNLKANA